MEISLVFSILEGDEGDLPHCFKYAIFKQKIKNRLKN